MPDEVTGFDVTVSGAGGEASLGDRLDDFYAPAVSLNRLRDSGGAAATPPDLLLRALAAPEVKVRHIPLLDILRSAYRDLGHEDR
ncbi:hypothetical protein SAMN05421505_10548 [Sinosporangium album]|uniref:Uncharacterized protein n=1 Tax=Sinosporangium album TaxID=504805 RepID=A0A1G7UZF4_9ACTN|nr:hypothetical protein [Sinosporangium album]SDG52942.1 hypothetical protein SAMN05421505_10548 [Sinosporangium album]